MRKIRIPIALIAFCTMAFGGADNRYRVYGDGFYKSSEGTRAFQFRNGGGGYSGGDLITVGKIDNMGPLNGMSMGEVVYKFHYLPTWNTGSSGAFKAEIFDLFHVELPYYWVNQYYEVCLFGICGGGGYTLSKEPYTIDAYGLKISFTPKSKQQVLEAEFNSECNRRQDGLCQGIIDYLNAWDPAKGAPVFEISNEPNMYPYIEPKLYAWFYHKWYQEIMKVFQLTSFGQQYPNGPLLMHGGLWIFEGLPSSIVNNLPLVGVFNRSTASYLSEFIDELERISGKSSRELISVGNLHFYPYTSSFSAYGSLNQHIENLSSLSAYLKSKVGSGETWITELGNINPFNEHDAAVHADAMLKGIERIARGNNITRWYWYTAKGEDVKLDGLDNLKWLRLLSKMPSIGGSISFGASKYGISINPMEVFNGILLSSGVDSKFLLPSPVEFVQLGNIATNYVNQKPIQGLMDENSHVREGGLTYFRLSNKSINSATLTPFITQ